MELYVHIPFCRQKCRYCAFASFPAQEAYFETYIDLLLQEAQSRKAEAAEQITTIYIGGGTPSLLSALQLNRLVTGLQHTFDLTHITEFTTEANPGTVTEDWLAAAASLGINRVSFGMQAYQEHLLQLLGRIHCFSDVEKSVFYARHSGIDNISLDLIFGIPGQTADEWDATAEAALSLNPSHISAYGLIPEEGTPLSRDLESGLLKLPDPDTEREMYNRFIIKAGTYGFRQYEISNFARNNRECFHNIGYWTQIPYIGLGVSAASMSVVRCTPEGISYTRSVNPEKLGLYESMIRSGRSAEKEQISPQEARFETMMLGLRMNCGINEAAFLSRHHLTVEQCYGRKMAEMEKRGLMIHENGFWKLTARGFDIQNSILVELMDD